MPAVYQLTSDPDTVRRLADNTLVPVGQPTADSRSYAAWLAADNIPDPAPALTPAQQYTAAINAGCQIVSTSTPALNGNYSILPNHHGGHERRTKLYDALRAIHQPSGDHALAACHSLSDLPEPQRGGGGLQGPGPICQRVVTVC